MDFVLNTFSVSFSFKRLKFATKLSREEAINLKLSIKLIPLARVLPLILKKSIASFHVLNVNCFASESLMKMFGFDLISLSTFWMPSDFAVLSWWEMCSFWSFIFLFSPLLSAWNDSPWQQVLFFQQWN